MGKRINAKLADKAFQQARDEYFPPIHNCGGRQWSYLEVVDRVSGEVERIRLDDANSAESVKMAAECAGVTVSAAWDVLLHGGTVATSGFVRRLAK